MPWLAAVAAAVGSAAGTAGSALGSAAGTAGSALGSAGSTIGSGLSSAGQAIGSGASSAMQGLQAGLQGGGAEAQHLAALGQQVPQGVNMMGPSQTFAGSPGFMPQSPGALSSLGQGVGTAGRMYGQMQGMGGGGGGQQDPMKMVGGLVQNLLGGQPSPLQPMKRPDPLAAPPVMAMPNDTSLDWLRSYSMQGGF